MLRCLALFLFLGLACITYPSSPGAEDLERVKLAIDFLTSACLKDEQTNLELTGEGSLSLWKRGGQGKISLKKEHIHGFVNSVKEEIRAAQNDKIRACIEPRIDMVMFALLRSQTYKSISTTESNGFIFDLKHCNIRSRNIVCDISIKSNDNDKKLRIYRTHGFGQYTKLFDDNGNEYIPNSIKVANNTTSKGYVDKLFIYDITTNIKFTFENVSANSKAVSLLEIRFWDEADNNQFKIQFRNVPLSS